MTPTNLRCESLTDPVGLDLAGRVPRLGWVIESDERGQAQSAYQVLVASSPALLDGQRPDRWDSGKVASDRSSHVDYAGRPLESRMPCFWQVRAWDRDNRPSAWSARAMWSMGLLRREDWQARWISCPAREDNPASPMLRKAFELPGTVTSATLYVTARGLYEIRLNGRRVGDHILAPEWTSYGKRIQYQTYDVTDLLRPGRNAIGAILGEGWYAGPVQQWPPRPHLYGSELELLAQLEVSTGDGAWHTIASDNTWRSTLEGPIRLSRIYEGETYDARQEQEGWNRPDFDDSKWERVRMRADLGEASLVAQINEPIRITQELQPVAVTHPKPGVSVFDFGQNMVGRVAMRLKANAGATIVLKHNECLNPDGTVYMENLRAGFKSKELRRQVHEYICRGGGDEVFEPRFTYQGFRYVEATGLPGPVTLTGRVFHSSAPFVGGFECSDPLLNRLWQNIQWSLRGNLMGVPTDCPARDERMGWTGDIATFCQTALFQMDLAAFFRKWLQDMRDDQCADGRYPEYAPHPGGDGKIHPGLAAWQDAGTIVPWCVYRNVGDKGLLGEHFESARRWVDYVRGRCPDLIWEVGGCLDHLNIGGSIPEALFSTAFFAHSAEIVGKMAGVLGREEERREFGALFEAVKAAFVRRFMAADGRLTGDSQAGYALALHFDLLPAAFRQRAAAHLLAAIARNNGRMTTGIIATHRMLLELSRHGYHEEACRLILSHDMPSWAAMIDGGATTVWERWDGWTPENGFQDPVMNSFNHCAFGSVGEWMMRCLAGLNPDDRYPGWRRFTVRPRPGGGLTEVRAHYDSIRGRIGSHWKLADGTLTLNVRIPVDATAHVRLPAGAPSVVTVDGRCVADAPGVTYLGIEDGTAVCEVGSGEYTFVAVTKGLRSPSRGVDESRGVP